MAEVSLLAIAESLLEKLGPYALQELKSCWRANEDLQKLIDTIEIIKAGLIDAENIQHGQQAQGKLDRERHHRLRNVLYDADDLFDEVFTTKAIREKLKGKEKVVEELHRFFSKSNPVVVPLRTAGKIKKIREELDGIVKDMEFFTLNRHSSDRTTSSRATDERETVSIPADEVIGRERDVSIILGRLLNPDSKEEDYPDVISIVGFGGLGKTSLAQLLYNNGKVEANFRLRAWACISDIKQTKQKARIISRALGIRESINSSTLEELRLEIGEKITNQKYLLVLDDFWDDDLQRWIDLRSLLRGGKRGSKVIVTTRSSRVAQVMDADTHDIKGLSDDKAKELFERWAFRSAASAEKKDKLMEMGSVIVRKCRSVPLAIKAVASLLNYYHGDEKRWKSVMESELLTLDQSRSLKILPVLKLSYDHLPSHLKHCFAFWSVFPKGCSIGHDELVAYWIAQGYVEHCSDRVRTGIQEKGGDYVRELTSRSFLQCHTLRNGKCKYYMHDLVHDLAQDVAGEEVLAVNKDNFGDTSGNSNNVKIKDARIRHLSFNGVRIGDDLLPIHKHKYVRSYICSHQEDHLFSRAAAWRKFSCLRLLVLRDMGLEWLPSSIGDLKHLRCLDISENKFTRLPDEITKLHNLKILMMLRCFYLESLPNNMNRLINLTCLALMCCHALTSMPRKFGELTSLEFLDRFVVGDGEKPNKCSGLEALAGLASLRGKLDVVYSKGDGGGVTKEKTIDLSSALVLLERLELRWPSGNDGESVWERDGIEFECSQLPSKLEALELYDFQGWKLPEWEKSFNKLLEVHLYRCGKCRHLPSFGRYPRLRVLYLSELDELEYIQAGEDDEFVSETHFPCLSSLDLWKLPKLKAWSRGMERLGDQFRLQLQHTPSSVAVVVAAFPRFQSLTQMAISSCPELTSMPLPLNGADTFCGRGGLKEPIRALFDADGILRGKTFKVVTVHVMA